MRPYPPGSGIMFGLLGTVLIVVGAVGLYWLLTAFVK